MAETHPNHIHNTRITEETLVLPPIVWKRMFPIQGAAYESVTAGRRQLEAILDGSDPRKAIIAGPCSIAFPEPAYRLAEYLYHLQQLLKDEFLIIMRTYWEKPRSGLGWQGLLVDPHLDGSYDVNHGLETAISLMHRIATLGLPMATEFLDTDTPSYLSDFITEATIGARDVASQTHRNMASGVSMPIGFKNTTSGDVMPAIEAVRYARNSGHFEGINDFGFRVSMKTQGNPYGHVILRGGHTPNHDEKSVAEIQELLRKKGANPRIIVDCSHGNSQKDYRNQPIVFEDVLRQIRNGNSEIAGVMLEVNIREGNQRLPDQLEGFDSSTLDPEVSVTDACISQGTLKDLLFEAYQGLRHPRA
ncbi:MAG: 3-deoxy-7-phosphoheptulonate synthase [Thermoanaerobaculia bacterium]|nr:3-deoxy-7-phosphoheptulonate synthase [Thermoanaerobaculia bacterium]